MTSAIVIGAGPAGLASAACLSRRGFRARVLEKAGDVGSAWRAHYDRLHLHTVKTHSALPGLPFPKEASKYPSRREVIAYLEAYARHHGIEPEFHETVTQVLPAGDGWRVLTAGGTDARADVVVVATGANRVPRVPDFPGQAAFGGRILHSRDYRNAEGFAGQRVLVVGMGNTGAEIALDLAERGVAVTIAVRSPLNIVRRDVLGRPSQLSAIMLDRLPPRIGDAVASFLRDMTVGDLRPWGIEKPARSPLRQLRDEGRTPVIDIGTVDAIRRGAIQVRPGIARFEAGGVAFADGRAERFDTVILATGYEAAVQSLFPATRLPVDDRGLPTEVVGRGERAGLAFVGFDIRQAGGLLRTIAAQAEAVAQALAARRAVAAAEPAH
jgi:cation diffusion facilitator CzcD-associated flavoprotein CzcO